MEDKRGTFLRYPPLHLAENFLDANTPPHVSLDYPPLYLYLSLEYLRSVYLSIFPALSPDYGGRNKRRHTSARWFSLSKKLFKTSKPPPVSVVNFTGSADSDHYWLVFFARRQLTSKWSNLARFGQFYLMDSLDDTKCTIASTFSKIF